VRHSAAPTVHPCVSASLRLRAANGRVASSPRQRQRTALDGAMTQPKRFSNPVRAIARRPEGMQGQACRARAAETRSSRMVIVRFLVGSGWHYGWQVLQRRAAKTGSASFPLSFPYGALHVLWSAGFSACTVARATRPAVRRDGDGSRSQGSPMIRLELPGCGSARLDCRQTVFAAFAGRNLMLSGTLLNRSYLTSGINAVYLPIGTARLARLGC